CRGADASYEKGENKKNNESRNHAARISRQGKSCTAKFSKGLWAGIHPSAATADAPVAPAK
ncbi:MAG: hypothetical protein ACI8QF_004198, partial [Limisphaerales bacterium]